MLAALTGMGLSAAAGLNAYIPFLVVALVARFTDLITLPAGYAWIESGWAIAICVVLLAFEVVLDKVPGVDSFNDAIQTAVRPAVGGLIFAATAAAQEYEDSSQLLGDNPWISVVLGAVVAALVHGGKAVSRPAIDAGSLGTATPVVSVAEDVTAAVLAVVAILWPVLVIFFLLALAGVLGGLVMTFRRWRRRARRRTRHGPDTDRGGVR